MIAAFKAARLFLPGKINEIKPDAAVIYTLKVFPFLDNSLILDGLKEELSSYLSKTEGEQVLQNTHVLLWWKKHAEELPKWPNAACKVALV